MTKISQSKNNGNLQSIAATNKQILSLENENADLRKQEIKLRYKIQAEAAIKDARAIQSQYDKNQVVKPDMKSELPYASIVDFINPPYPPSNPVKDKQLREQAANMNIVEYDDTIPNDQLTPLKNLPSYNDKGGGWILGQIARGADVYNIVSKNYIIAYNRSRCYLLNEKTDDNVSADPIPDILIYSADGMGCPSDVQGIYRNGYRDLTLGEFNAILTSKPDYNVLVSGYSRFKNLENVSLDISNMKIVF